MLKGSSLWEDSVPSIIHIRFSSPVLKAAQGGMMQLDQDIKNPQSFNLPLWSIQTNHFFPPLLLTFLESSSPAPLHTTCACKFDGLEWFVWATRSPVSGEQHTWPHQRSSWPGNISPADQQQSQGKRTRTVQVCSASPSDCSLTPQVISSLGTSWTKGSISLYREMGFFVVLIPWACSFTSGTHMNFQFMQQPVARSSTTLFSIFLCATYNSIDVYLLPYQPSLFQSEVFLFYTFLIISHPAK